MTAWQIVGIAQNSTRISWNEAPGEIVFVGSEIFSSKRPIYKAIVQYRYIVDGDIYESDHIVDYSRYYDENEDNSQTYPLYFYDEEAIYELYQPGDQITVYYNPRNPQNSILKVAFIPSLRDFVITQAIVGMIVFICFYIWRKSRKNVDTNIV